MVGPGRSAGLGGIPDRRSTPSAPWGGGSRHWSALAIVATAVLTACGSGGDDDPTGDSVPGIEAEGGDDSSLVVDTDQVVVGDVGDVADGAANGADAESTVGSGAVGEDLRRSDPGDEDDNDEDDDDGDGIELADDDGVVAGGSGSTDGSTAGASSSETSANAAPPVTSPPSGPTNPTSTKPPTTSPATTIPPPPPPAPAPTSGITAQQIAEIEAQLDEIDDLLADLEASFAQD